MASTIVQISVGSDGTSWCRDSLGKLYKLEGGKLRQNPTGTAAHIDVGSANHVWCYNNAGELFKLTGSAYDSAWEKDPVGKGITSRSVASDTTIYVTNKKGEIWKREASGDWSLIPALQPQQPASKTHTVKSGEHLLQIIRDTYPGISEADALKKADEVARLNGWPNRDKILQPGEVIVLEA